jgi:hypothetical protein
MARHKRTATQREADLLLIMGWMTECATHADIATLLNQTRPYKLSRQQVSQDIAKARELYRERVINEALHARQIEADRFLRMAREAWLDYQNSKKQPHLVKHEEEGRKNSRGFKMKSGTFRIVKEERLGDPRYLALAITALREHSAILGLRAPDEIPPPPPPGTSGNYFQVNFTTTGPVPKHDPMDVVKELNDQPAPKVDTAARHPQELKTGAGRILIRATPATG